MWAGRLQLQWQDGAPAGEAAVGDEWAPLPAGWTYKLGKTEKSKGADAAVADVAVELRAEEVAAELLVADRGAAAIQLALHQRLTAAGGLAQLVHQPVSVGLGRIVALHCRSSISYQIRSHIRNLYF